MARYKAPAIPRETVKRSGQCLHRWTNGVPGGIVHLVAMLTTGRLDDRALCGTWASRVDIKEPATCPVCLELVRKQSTFR